MMNRMGNFPLGLIFNTFSKDMGLPQAARVLETAAQQFPKYHTSLAGGKSKPSIASQIREKVKLGYDPRDLTVLGNQKVIVNPDAIEQRIFGKVFGSKRQSRKPAAMEGRPSSLPFERRLSTQA